jgi:hypothetical protein
MPGFRTVPSGAVAVRTLTRKSIAEYIKLYNITDNFLNYGCGNGKLKYYSH